MLARVSHGGSGARECDEMSDLGFEHGPTLLRKAATSSSSLDEEKNIISADYATARELGQCVFEFKLQTGFADTWMRSSPHKVESLKKISRKKALTHLRRVPMKISCSLSNSLSAHKRRPASDRLFWQQLRSATTWEEMDANFFLTAHRREKR